MKIHSADVELLHVADGMTERQAWRSQWARFSASLQTVINLCSPNLKQSFNQRGSLDYKGLGDHMQQIQEPGIQ
jgi:hypothetical protein